jgi:hypothetical protein
MKNRVTQGQYKALVGLDAWKQQEERIKSWTGQSFDPRNFIGENLPIIVLTRDEVNSYLSTLRAELMALWQIAYPTQHYPNKKLILPRKPTEAEWE